MAQEHGRPDDPPAGDAGWAVPGAGSGGTGGHSGSPDDRAGERAAWAAPGSGFDQGWSAPGAGSGAGPGWAPGQGGGSWQQPGAGASGWQQGQGWQGAPGGYPGPPWGTPPPPRPGVVPLRPLTLGDILNGAFSYIRGNPKAVLGFAALIGAIASLLPALGTGSMFNSLLTLEDAATGGEPVPPPEFNEIFPVEALVMLGASILVQFAAGALLSGLLAGIIGMAVLGRKLGFSEAFALVRPRLGAVLGAVLLMSAVNAGLFVLGIGGMAGGIALSVVFSDSLLWLGVLVAISAPLAVAVLAVFVNVRIALAVPAAVLEGVSGGAALARSWRLSRGSFWRLLGILLLTMVITSLVSQVLSTPFSLIGLVGSVAVPEPQLAAVLYAATLFLGTAVAMMITYPFSSGVSGLLYVDLRMRREALDLRLRQAAQSGSPVGPEVYLPAYGSAAPPPAADTPQWPQPNAPGPAGGHL
ncbi:glycerophosphoryl diester phosphodiesterase membrane domain-containing protein [Nocardiopsis coralliicola]